MARKRKSGIRIKPANRGKYTKQSGGKVTGSKIARDLKSKNPKTRARANFARMARRGFKPLSKKSSKSSSSSKRSRVQGHTRKLSSGRRVRVKGHSRKKG